MRDLASPFEGASPFDGAAGKGPKFTVAPTITGGNQIGDTLTSTTGAATGSGTVTYARLWFRDGVSLGITTATYVTVAAGVHTCRVIATDAKGGRTRFSNAITTFLSSGEFSSEFSSDFNRAV